MWKLINNLLKQIILHPEGKNGGRVNLQKKKKNGGGSEWRQKYMYSPAFYGGQRKKNADL